MFSTYVKSRNILFHVPQCRPEKDRSSPYFEKIDRRFFEGKWKKDKDLNDFGQKMFGPDNVHWVEYVETVLDNAAGLYILHKSMMNEDWVETELDDIMYTFMESGKRNHVLITIDFVD